jgi:dolichyl-phosphate-mannose-protein mannosyltransferase
MLLLGKPTASISMETPVLRRLRTAERIGERLAPVLAVFLILVFSIWAWRASEGVRLENDELLEIAAATAPAPAEVVSYLAAGVDYNPPLSHFLVRASLATFGGSDWAARLPSFLGVLTLLVCLYIFVSRWLSRSYGVLAMLVVLCLPVRIYAREARPYGLVLGLAALALVFYQQAARPGRGGRRALALSGFAVVNGCLPASHYYAVLVVGAWLLAEAVKSWGSRRADWPLLLCTVAPPAIVLALMANVMRAQHQQLAHYFAKGNILSFNHGYESIQIDPLVYGMAAIFILGAAAANLVRQEVVGTFRLPGGSNQQLVLGLGLLLLPLEGAVLTQFVTHAYLPRYFLAAAIGFSIGVCYCVVLLDSMVPGATMGVVAALSLGFANIVTQEFSHPVERPFPSSELNAMSSPVLFDAPVEYLRVLHYAPALRSKLLAIADPAASLRSRAYDTDDRIMLALASKGRVDTITLSAAAHTWGRFSLVPRPQEYAAALKCVVDAGAQVRLAGPWGDGNFVFDVVVTPESLRHIDDCSRREQAR